MSDILSRRLALLGANPELLADCLHGIERETLRIDARGELSRRPHPHGLGSALTHPQITTDYSEALLEFITPTGTRTPAVLEALDVIHRAAFAELGGERLWSGSMPCRLPAEDEIPIADYGNSNIGRLKHIYRRGLALRYSRTMQCIAGIHYNFSLPDAAWALLREAEGDGRAARDYQSARYIALIRNFRRYSWLLMYLFGASPALDAGFLRGRPHRLQQWDDQTLYLPHATSLRMSDLGYQSEAQASLTPDYNDLTTYTESLRRAVGTPYAPYGEIGTHQDGQWVQLNTNILQIENEYYATIRPKRVTRSGERPVQALMARGVQYIEVRCLDIDPFLPLGIDLTAARFIDAFLVYCALEESPLLNGECAECGDNFAAVVREGRKPGLRLRHHRGEIELRDWATELLDRIEACAAQLDASYGGDAHRQAVAAQRRKVADVSLTPSARVLATLEERGESFADFGLRQSEAHAAYFASQPLTAAEQATYLEMARQSLTEQAELEAAPQGDFDTFVAAYQASILATIGV